MDTPGQRIRELRIQMGISQAEFAGMVGMSAASLCLLEAGDSKIPSLKNAIRMAETLNKSVGWIVTGKDGLDVATTEEHELLDLLRNMTDDALQALLATARAMPKKG